MVTGACFVSTLSVAILAGGKSSRMGFDKRFLKWDNQTFLDRAFSLARELVDDDKQVLLCGDVPGYDCLPDLEIDQGPLSGIRSAMSVTNWGNYILVIPVDMPFLSVEILQGLVKSQKSVVAYENFELPMLFKCDEHACDVMKKLPKQSIRAFLEALNCERIGIPMEKMDGFLNINSSDEYPMLLLSETVVEIEI